MTQPKVTFRLRVVVAKEFGSQYPQIVFGFPEDTWEAMSPEEWNTLKRKQCEKWLDPDLTAYDFAEAVLNVPLESLSALFSPSIPVTIKRTDDDHT